MSVLAGIAAVAGAAATVGGTVLNQYNADKTRQFNREEAAKNRAFQKQMAQNNIKYTVNQANEMGISPSLVLGDQTKTLGGSQASVGNPPTSSGMGQLANVLQEQNRIKALEEMNEDRLQAIKEIHEDKLQNMKNSTTNDNYIKNNYTKEHINSLIANLDNVQI